MNPATIQIKYADSRTEQRTLTAGEYLVGRNSGDLVLSDVNVSGRHGRLDVSGGGVTFTDLGSSNGSFDERGERLSGVYALKPSEPIKLGLCQITLVSDGAGAAAGGTRAMPMVEAIAVSGSTNDVVALLDQDNVPQAIELADRLLARPHEPDAELYAARARARVAWKELPGAADDLKQAIAIKPTVAAYYVDLGAVLVKAGLLLEAQAQFGRALHIEPAHVDAKLGVACAKAEEAESDAAVRELESITGLTTRSDEARRESLARVYISRGFKLWEDYRGDIYPVSHAGMKAARAAIDKCNALRPLSDELENETERRLKHLQIASERRYRGGIGGGFLAISVALIGMIGSGFFGLLYATSAVAYFMAMRVPAYLHMRHHLQGYQKASFGDRVSDTLFGGWWIGTSSTSILGAITGQLQFMAVLSFLRLSIQTALLPFTVLGAMKYHYSWKHAGAFAALALAVSAMFST